MPSKRSTRRAKRTKRATTHRRHRGGVNPFMQQTKEQQLRTSFKRNHPECVGNMELTNEIEQAARQHPNGPGAYYKKLRENRNAGCKVKENTYVKNRSMNA